MIIDLTIENFKSFSDLTKVSFAAGTTSRLPGNLVRLRNGERFVKSMALYGPNGSGKTTLLDGLYALRSFVLFSSKDQKPTDPVPRFAPFALDRARAGEPSRVALTINLDGDRYTLDVSATAERVWKESLSVRRTVRQPSRKVSTKTLIERAWDPQAKTYSTVLNEDLGPEATRSGAREQTTPNRLILGKLASMNSAVARRIIEWFDDDLEFYDMHRNPRAEEMMLAKSAGLLRENREFAALITRFMRDADVGIKDLSVSDEKRVEAVLSESDNTVQFEDVTVQALLFQHATEDGSEIFFRRQQQSSGTLRFVALLTAILQPGPRRRLVCIDELSASMHPDMVRRLIRIVHSRRFNPLGSQILFTTHDTHLMDPRQFLRRDQVTICDKDRFGRSTAKRLDIFNDHARSDANLQKQYLEGRFRGLPQFGPSLEDVPTDDESLEVGP